MLTTAFLTALALALGGLLALWQRGEASSARADAQRQRARGDALQVELERARADARRRADELADQVRAVEALRSEDRDTHERLIAGYKAEIAGLEADLAATHDPAALRARIRRLLQVGPSTLRDLPPAGRRPGAAGAVPR